LAIFKWWAYSTEVTSYGSRKTLLAANSSPKRSPRKIFGWKNVHKHEGEPTGKKQDKGGHWRKAKVPDYANDQRHAYAIDDQMKKLGRLERYDKELSKITKAQNLPPEWATPEQRSRAALKALGK
jgi:hypothetical protein